jgi:hypothetical protein
MAGVILQVSEEIMDTFLQTHHFNTTFFTPETLALVTLFWFLVAWLYILDVCGSGGTTMGRGGGAGEEAG